MEDNDNEKYDVVEQAFDLDYDVAQAFCSHTVPKAVLFFTGEALVEVVDFEPEYGEGDNDNKEGGEY